MGERIPRSPKHEGDKEFGISRRRKILKTIGVAAACVTCAASGWMGRDMFEGLKGEVSPFARVDHDRTRANVELFEFDPDTKINVADAYFSTSIDAPQIQAGIKIDTPGIDVVPDPEFRMNMQLDGVGVVSYEIPLDAVSQRINEQTQKVDIVIDPAAVSQTHYWYGAGPEVRKYTIDGDGKPNFGDTAGFRLSVLESAGAMGGIVNVDTLRNSLDAIDSGIAHDLRVAGLKLLPGACQHELDSRLRKEIVNSVTEVVEVVGRKEDLGTVSIGPGELKWRDEPGPEGTSGVSYTTTYTFGEMTPKETTCSIPPEMVKGEK